MTQSIAHAARAVLLTADPAAKVRIARAMARAWRRGLVRHDFDAPMPDMPARPAEPELLPPNQMPSFFSYLAGTGDGRSEEHTSELQSLMRISYAVFCLTKKKVLYSNTTHKKTRYIRYTKLYNYQYK